MQVMKAIDKQRVVMDQFLNFNFQLSIFNFQYAGYEGDIQAESSNGPDSAEKR